MRSIRLGTVRLVALAALGWSLGTSGAAIAASKPVALATADLDHDLTCLGCEDLVVGDRRGKNVSVYLSHGDGTFAAPVVLPVDAAVLAVATGDCDGDGDVDVIASTVSSSRALTVFVNREQQGSPGTFLRSSGSPIAVPAGGPTALVTHDSSGQPLDVDGDGALDVAIIAHGKRLGVLLGDGNCGFSGLFTPLREGRLTAVAAADFDGTHGVDLVVTDRHTHIAYVLFNDGTGSFPVTVESDTRYPSAVVAADVNGDSRPDILITDAKNENSATSLGLLRTTNFGNQTFSAANVFGAGGRRPAALVAGTFDADAHLDVVVANQIDNVLGFATGDGFGDFNPPLTFPTGGTKPVAIVAADFDLDGSLDVAVANAGAGGVTVCPGDGSGFVCTPIGSLVTP